MQQNQVLIQLLQHITNEEKLNYLIKHLESFNDKTSTCTDTFAGESVTRKLTVNEKKITFRKTVAKKFFEKYPNFKNAHSAKQ